jgi:Tol biopolymer transport system component
MSGDGRYIAFTSAASNLHVNDTDGTTSVFLLDRNTTTLTYIAPADGSQNGSRRPQVSDDGSMVVFKSNDATLVPGDTNGKSDLFLWRAGTGTFTRINEGPQPSEPDGGGSTAALSADGSKIAFISGATNIWTPAGSEDKPSVYVYDVATATITHKLYTYPWGSSRYGLALSADGRYVVYKGGAPAGGGRLNLWKFDLTDDTETLVGPPPGSDGGGATPACSPDGRFVAFVSGSSNVVTNDFNDDPDIFWVDTSAGPSSVRRVSEVPPSLLPAGGTTGPSMTPACSSDAQYVVYATDASNVTTVRDDEGYTDIVLHDMQTGASTLLTVDGSGKAADDDSAGPDISDSGMLVAFSSQATDIALDAVTANRDHVYLKDLATGIVTLISKTGAGAEGDNGSMFPSLAGDGSVVVFASQAANLTADTDNNAGAYDIYAYNVSTGVLTLVSRGTGGGTADGASTIPRVHDTGVDCIFESDATDLMAGDTNGMRDIYKVNLTTFAVTRVSVGDGSPGAEANGASTVGSMNATGNIVAFLSAATNLTADTDGNAVNDVFVRDIPNDTTTLISVWPDGQRRELRPFGEPGRPVRGLRLGGHGPDRERHQRVYRRVRLRPHRRHDHAGGQQRHRSRHQQQRHLDLLPVPRRRQHLPDREVARDRRFGKERSGAALGAAPLFFTHGRIARWIPESPLFPPGDGVRCLIRPA